MTDGLSAVMARITQIESLISPPATAATTSSTATSTSATGFQDALDQINSGTDPSTDTGTSTDPSTGTVAQTLRDQVVSIASKYLGTPYRWGGTDPSTGLDCSGFTDLVYKQLGINLPRTSAAQARTGTAVASLSSAQPGDLVFFGSPVHHVGIYLGNGKMIDAPHTGQKVKIQNVYETPSHIRRVLPVSTSALTSSSASDPSAVTSLSDLSGTTDLTGLAGLTGTNTAGDAALTGTPYAALFTAAGQRYGVDPALLSAIAKTESGYDASAVSGAGAEGLMQLTPATASSLGVDPQNPAQAITGAARLMSDNLRTFSGRVDLALAAYNAGAGAVRKYNGVPPYAETQNYVQEVQQNWGQLR